LRKISFSLIYKVTITVVLVSLISACAPPRKAAVTERETITQRAEAERIGGRLIRYVQPGDTLYSIAFAHNLSPNDVAAWNDVSDTRKLHVGKRIRLTQPIGFKPKPTSVKVESIVVGKPPAAAANSTANTTASTTQPKARSFNAFHYLKANKVLISKHHKARLCAPRASVRLCMSVTA